MRKMIYLRSQLPLSNNNVEKNGETLTLNTVLGERESKNKKMYILSEFPSLEHFYNLFHLMMNFDKSISLIFRRDHCRIGFEPTQNLKLCSSDNHYPTAPYYPIVLIVSIKSHLMVFQNNSFW